MTESITSECPAGPHGIPFRLAQMRQLLERLNLQKYLYRPDEASVDAAVPIVHIAGTKGKGSTSSMVAAALSAGGIRTGLYTSPHLHRLEERFRIDGRPCEPSDIVTMVDRIKTFLDSEKGEHDHENVRSIGTPSFFELTTAMALMHFDLQKCDAIVLEVGLGGRLDSTNVCSPTVTAITPIGPDHQHVLGNTLTSIATEKAGIIKQGIPVVCGISAADPAQSDVIDVVANRATERSAPMYLLDRDFGFDYLAKPDWGSQVAFHGNTAPLSKGVAFDLSLEGNHQAANAAVAMAIIDLLRDQGVGISANAACDGISKLNCEARIERFRLPDDVIVIVDAAHNQNSIDALCATIKRRRGNRDICFVFGTSRDKSASEMLIRIATVTDSLILTQFAGNPRFTPTEDLLPLVPQALVESTAIAKDPIDACRLALKSATPGGMIVVCGSFFIAAETRQWLMGQEEIDS